MTAPLFLDTHIVIWIAAGQERKLSHPAKSSLAGNGLLYSPMVRLELDYLHDSGKIRHSADAVLEQLHKRLDFSESATSFRDVCRSACNIGWTRETFDRLIVAEAAFHKAKLVTADEIILQHYPLAVW